MDPGNWFLALPADPGDWYAARVPPTPPGTRRFDGADLHFTVAFLGAVGEARARAAWAAARGFLGDAAASQGAADAWRQAPFEVALGGVVLMGNPRRATALAAEAADGRAPLEAAMGALRDVAWAAAERAAAIAWADAVDVHGVRLRLDRLALYAWAADRRERQFRIVEERLLP